MLNILAPGAPFPEPFPGGALLLVDKPLGWTSFDVVNKTRYLLCRRLGVKKFKVGHAGTLDPLATGLLLLCLGDHTKKIETLQAQAKTYTGVFTFGATTPSFDLEKAIDATFPTAHLTDALLQETARRFVGEIEQIPPVFSAVKVEGKRLYKNARTGQEVELVSRPVRIDAFELGPLRPVPSAPGGAVRQLNAKTPPIYQHPDYPEGLQCAFRVVCSKGTYIRSLAQDLGQAVGSGAYLSSLRRTHSGGHSVAEAWGLDALSVWLG